MLTRTVSAKRTKEQSVLRRIMSSFKGENMHRQCNVFSYRIGLYFHDYKIAIEIDGNGPGDRNIDYKIKRKKAIEQKLACKFIRIDPDKEDFNLFRTINEIFRHIKQSTKETLIKKILARLLRLESKSDDMIISKAIKFIVKKVLSDYK